MKLSGILWIAGLASVVLASPAQADSYPERPIRMIVAWAAGGGTDIAARPVAKHLSQKLNVPIVVDNRAGASGMIGTEYVANAPADGYVIQYTVADSHSVNPHLFPNIRYDAVNDFVPIAVVGYNPCALVVNSHKSIATLDQPDAIAPTFHIFWASKLAWFDPGDDLPKHERFRPDTRGLDGTEPPTAS